MVITQKQNFILNGFNGYGIVHVMVVFGQERERESERNRVIYGCCKQSIALPDGATVRPRHLIL